MNDTKWKEVERRKESANALLAALGKCKGHGCERRPSQARFVNGFCPTCLGKAKRAKAERARIIKEQEARFEGISEDWS